MKIAVIGFASILAIAFGQDENPQGCINASDFSADFDFFPDKVNATYSEFWDIKYSNTYKTLRNQFLDATYVLYQCGTEPPVLNGSYTLISVPIQDGCAIASTADIPYIELLGARTQLKGWIGYPGGADAISSSCVNQLLSEGKFLNVPQPGNSSSPEFKALLALDGAGDDMVAFIGDYDMPALNNTVIIYSYKESSNFGTLEWLKFYSAFFNLEATAIREFDIIVDRYNCGKENAQTVVTDSQDNPIAVWAYYSNFSGEDGFDIAECPNYYCEYAKDCGATLLESREGSNILNYSNILYVYMNITEFVEFAKSANHWFYPSDNWDTTYAHYQTELDVLPSVQNKQVFDYQKRNGSSSWFENRFAEPDVVLQDFCDIVGTDLAGTHTRVWFRNVFTEGTESMSTCKDVEAPLTTQATECVVATNAPIPVPTTAPSQISTTAPSQISTNASSVAPTTASTVAPTTTSTVEPTTASTVVSTTASTVEPTTASTVEPTTAPTVVSTNGPTVASTKGPTVVSTTDPKTSATSRAPIFMVALFTIIVIIVG